MRVLHLAASGCLCSLSFAEGAVDGGEDKGVEMRVGCFTRGRVEILLKEPYSPFECRKGVIALDLVREPLRLFDELTVVYASLRPVLRMAADVEFVKSWTMPRRAEDDVLAVMFGFLAGVHDSVGNFEGVAQLDIADVGRLCRSARQGFCGEYGDSKAVENTCFEMNFHIRG